MQVKLQSKGKLACQANIKPRAFLLNAALTFCTVTVRPCPRHVNCIHGSLSDRFYPVENTPRAGYHWHGPNLRSTQVLQGPRNRPTIDACALIGAFVKTLRLDMSYYGPPQIILRHILLISPCITARQRTAMRVMHYNEKSKCTLKVI